MNEGNHDTKLHICEQILIGIFFKGWFSNLLPTFGGNFLATGMLGILKLGKTLTC